jgi:hypothetical protein
MKAGIVSVTTFAVVRRDEAGRSGRNEYGSVEHRYHTKGAGRRAGPAAGAGGAVMQGGTLDPALPLEGQEVVRATGRDAPSASGAARGVDVGKCGAFRVHLRASSTRRMPSVNRTIRGRAPVAARAASTLQRGRTGKEKAMFTSRTSSFCWQALVASALARSPRPHPRRRLLTTIYRPIRPAQAGTEPPVVRPLKA